LLHRPNRLLGQLNGGVSIPNPPVSGPDKPLVAGATEAKASTVLID
jgi:hypothetical protein